MTLFFQIVKYLLLKLIFVELNKLFKKIINKIFLFFFLILKLKFIKEIKEPLLKGGVSFLEIKLNPSL